MDYERIWDGAFIEAAFERLHARLAWLFVVIGVDDAVAQSYLIIALIGALLWLFARLSTVGYRINLPVGVAIQSFTLGPVLTFLLVAIPAWLTFRQPAIAKALLSFLPAQ